MKRSEINQAINQAIWFFKKRGFFLPPFAYWSPYEWQEKNHLRDEIKKTRLGWDVTDFGLGDFKHFGRIIFTLRNGHPHLKQYPKTYCQKVMFLKEDQKSPIHYHKNKMEDIINAGGGNIMIRLWTIDENKSLSKKSLTVKIDSQERKINGGQAVCLAPGQSICVTPLTYHQFWAQKNLGLTLSMEISSVNNDTKDNFWLKPAKRFPKIEEDEARHYLLCSEYESFL